MPGTKLLEKQAWHADDFWGKAPRHTEKNGLPKKRYVVQQWCTHFKTPPWPANKPGLISTLVLSLFKTVMALIRDNTDKGLKSEEKVMHAIASTYSTGVIFPT